MTADQRTYSFLIVLVARSRFTSQNFPNPVNPSLVVTVWVLLSESADFFQEHPAIPGHLFKAIAFPKRRKYILPQMLEHDGDAHTCFFVR